ncbi:hypothetical protein ACWCQW_53165 [Streptomyces mirabilis]
MRRCDEPSGDTEGGYPVAFLRADPQLQQRPAVPQHEIVDLFAEQFQAADSMRRVTAKQRDLSQEQQRVAAADVAAQAAGETHHLVGIRPGPLESAQAVVLRSPSEQQ